MEDPAETADRLYAVPPQRFVAERDAAVAEARDAGDRETATALGKLRRPTVAAWLVNLLALRRPELVAGLAELAGALQAAQRELDGARLRELSGQRRSTVSALVATARSLALVEDPSLSEAKLPLAEVETTLNAALADRDLSEVVRSGRLTKAGGYEGFGELPKARLRPIPGGAAAAEQRPGAAPVAAEPDEATRQAVAAEVAGAHSAAAAASAELDQAAATQAAAKQQLAEVDAAIAELTEQRSAAATRLAEAEAASMAARRAVVAARRRVGEAEAAAEALDAAT